MTRLPQKKKKLYFCSQLQTQWATSSYLRFVPWIQNPNRFWISVIELSEVHRDVKIKGGGAGIHIIFSLYTYVQRWNPK